MAVWILERAVGTPQTTWSKKITLPSLRSTKEEMGEMYQAKPRPTHTSEVVKCPQINLQTWLQTNLIPSQPQFNEKQFNKKIKN